mgnify:CR=1 FL=1
MLRKGVFPYEYLDDISKLEETHFPPEKAFSTRLAEGTIYVDSPDPITPKEISEEDYQHAQNVFRAFNCKTVRDYIELYCLLDVLLSADVFENFVDISLRDYSLDRSHYVTLASFAWDAMLKMTKVKLELLTDPDMYLFYEQGIRGGVSMICNRYAKANHKYLEQH